MEFYSHIAETRTRKERTQYCKTKCKAVAFPEDCIPLIIDSMNQRKTSIPYWLNPPKNVSNFFQLRTKLMAVKVRTERVIIVFGPLPKLFTIQIFRWNV